jgi:hypothetical protein
MRAYHYASGDSIGLNGLRGEHQQRMLLEERINVVGIAIAGNHAILDRLKETCHLPSRSATFRVTDQTFLCHDRDSIAWGTFKCLQDRVPNIRLVFLVGLCARTMDGKNADVVSS